MKRADVWRMGILLTKLFGAIIRNSRCLMGEGGGLLSGVPFKVLLCEDLVGVVTSGDVTEMVVSVTIRSTMAENSLQTVLVKPSYCQLKFYFGEIEEFAFFLRKVVENIEIFYSFTAMIQMMRKHIFWPIIDCSNLFCYLSYTLSKCSFMPNQWACHFQSRDKDGGHSMIGHGPNPPTICKHHIYRTGVIAN